MPIKIRNWKLAALALIIFCLLTSLGFWQLSRARQKQILINAFSARTQQTPVSASMLSQPQDWRFYRATLTGTFDNEHTLLLDNKTFHGQIGYEIYTPFHVSQSSVTVLVDRGFVPANAARAILPAIREIKGSVTITGMLNLPPAYVALGDIEASSQRRWPLRLEYIHTAKIAGILNYPLFPYVLQITPNDTAAYPIEWQVSLMSPERHIAYAVQWFALALTLLILFVALNRGKSKPPRA